MDLKVEYLFAAAIGLVSVVCLKILLRFFRQERAAEKPTNDVTTSRDDVTVEDTKSTVARRRKGGASQRKTGGAGFHADKSRKFAHDWLVCSLKGHSGSVLDAQFSGDAKFLASCADDGEVGQEITHQNDPVHNSKCWSLSRPIEPTKEQCQTDGDSLTVGEEIESQVYGTDSGRCVGDDEQSTSSSFSSSSLSPIQQKSHSETIDLSSTTRKRQRHRKKHPKKKLVCAPSGGDTTKQQCGESPHVSVPLSDDELYHVLCQYTVPMEQLAVLGFPQACGVRAGRAYVYRVTRQSPTTSHRMLDVSAKEFVPRSHMTTTSSPSAFDQIESSSCLYLSKKSGSDSGYTEEEDKSTASSGSSSLSSSFTQTENCSSASDCLGVSTEFKSPASDGSTSDTSSESSSSVMDAESDSSSSSLADASSSSSSSSPTSDVSRLAGSGVVWPDCVRCTRQFGVTLGGVYLHSEQRQCVFHWGKLQLQPVPPPASPTPVVTSARRWRHSCCDGRPGSRGCSVAADHVWTGLLPGLNGPLRGYVFSRKPRITYYSQQRPSILALDCEMCFSSRGMQLARVSVVDVRGRRVYDSLVQPEYPVLDYNTRFSGITPRRLATATRSLRAVQSDLLGFIVADTLLVGHGLENDLRALRLVHSHVVDTSTLFVHARGLPFRHKLSGLVASCLGRRIQTASTGHDSLEDARACMQLLLWRVRQDMGLDAAK